MITKKDLEDFAGFCDDNYGLKIPEFVFESYIKSISSRNQSETHKKRKKAHQDLACGVNNVKCFYVTFDSAKCHECPY
ncbi:MAG TPA: hypothetical protein VLQ91_14475 [Draconibacterium sp.]|nr:hypothetical protein [Draconibacterium sp.]